MSLHETAGAKAETVSTARNERYDDVLSGMLLQRHAELRRDIRALSVCARVIAVGLVVYASLADDPAARQVLAIVLAAVIVVSVWFGQRQRWDAELVGLERTIAEVAGGSPHDVYIRARYYMKRRPGYGPDTLLVLEPVVWLVACASVLVTAAV